MPGKKILIVDDEPAFVSLFRSRLEPAGFDVCSASDGEEALAKVNQEKPDLIVLDVVIPKMSGYEVMKKIRDNSATRRIPSIVISGRAGMKDFFDGVSGVEFMQKPFDLKLLVDRVEAILGKAAEKGQDSKRAVLIGVEDFITNKVRALLHSRGFQVLSAMTESDAVRLVKNLCPRLLCIQFWEDESILNPRKLLEGLRSNPSASKTEICAYCSEASSIPAMQVFQHSQLLVYKDSEDLVSKMDSFLKKQGYVSAA